MNRKILAILIFALLLFPHLLFAAITASYVPNHPLYLQPFNELRTTLYGGGQNPYQNKMAIYLGRFTIDTGNERIRNIRLTSPIDNNIFFKGPKLNNTLDQEFGFGAKAILHNNGQYKDASNLWEGLNNPIHPINTYMQGIITIDFFLISDENANFFIPQGTYYHVRGLIGTFSLGYSTTDDRYWDANFNPFVGEDNKPLPDLPFLGSGGNFPDEDIDYDDPPEITYNLTIQEQSDGFTLSDAIGTQNKALVAQAQLTVNHMPQNSTSSVDLAFTSANHSSQFLLSQNLNGDSHTIPYSLIFDTTPVNYGEGVRWGSLHTGLRTKNIYVTNIPAAAAETALSGTYQDTIYVTITPVDTI